MLGVFSQEMEEFDFCFHHVLTGYEDLEAVYASLSGEPDSPLDGGDFAARV